MTPRLHVVGASRLDVDALELVLAFDPPIELVATDIATLLGHQNPLTVLVHQPIGEAWTPQEARLLAVRGHRVLVMGDFDAAQLRTLNSAGLPHVLRRHLRRVHEFTLGTDLEGSQRSTPGRALSRRELDVVELLLKDPPLARDEIAAELRVTPATAKVHVENIRKKIGAVGLSLPALRTRLRDLGFGIGEH